MASPVFAQNNEIISVPLDRDASFIDRDHLTAPTPDISGFAAAPVIIQAPVPPPAAAAPTPLLPAPVVVAPVTPAAATPIVTTLPEAAPPKIVAPAAAVAPVPAAPENIWNGTPLVVADRALSLLAPTASPVLNDLARRLLAADSDASLASARVEKLLALGDVADAWMLATHATKQVDDIAFRAAAETSLATDMNSVCDTLPSFAPARANIDWQPTLAVCQLRDKNAKAAQVTLDVMRSQSARDDIFLQIADKNLLGASKTLPTQLTPLSPSLLALLRLTNLPLPGELYAHPDYALTLGLLRASARQDSAQLGLAERAASRGVVDASDLASIYQSIQFKPDDLKAPLLSLESGARQRALLCQAALTDKDPRDRLLYAVKFAQAAPAALLNNTGSLLLAMLGDVKADATATANALTVAQIYMLADKPAEAQKWLASIKPDFTAPDFLTLWPQFALAGWVPAADFAAEFAKWQDAILTRQTDAKTAHDAVAAVLLLFDAAGLTVPDTAWAPVLVSQGSEKHIALSPVLLERLRSAAAGNRRAETILFSAAVAGDSDISLPVAVEITRALRLAGFKKESETFARQTLALLAKPN